MRKLSKLLAFALALVMVLGLATTAMADEAKPLEGSIVILHSNDVHGAVEGYATMAALKEYYKAQGADVLLVDAGDYIQGTTYVSVSQGKTAIELMNLAGYDFAALGNHEFDYGFENLKTIMADAKFKVLSANTLYDGKAAFGDHAVVELGGKKVGIFGMETPETATKAHPAKIKGVTFPSGEDMYAIAKAEVAALKAENVDYIVCLGHLGVDDETAATANRSIDMLAKVEGIDVLIDGHSHSTIEDIQSKTADGTNKVGNTIVTSTGTKFANFGVVTIAPDGSITAKLISAEEAAALVTPVAAVKEKADAVVKEIEDMYGATFAKTEVRLNGDRDPGNRTEETNLGDLITDAILWYATKDGGLDVDDDHVVALTNGGGIRATIEAGDINRNDVNTVLPFGNTVAIVYIKGSALLEALEASTYCTPTAIGGFPQVAGIEFTVDNSKTFDEGELYPDTTYYAPKSINRVTINSINGKDFDPEATYAVVTNDFTAAGGDTYYAFSVATVMDTGTPMDEALIDYINTELKGVVPAATYDKLQGRIHVQRYPDLDTSAGYAKAVQAVTDAGIMNGKGDGKFDAAGTTTYAEFATVLARLADVDTTAGETWYAAGVEYATAHGVTVSDPTAVVSESDAVAAVKAIYTSATLTDLVNGDGTFTRSELAQIAAAVMA